MKPAKPKVLIVDDDPSFLTLAGHLLREAGFLVSTASDSMQGLMFAKRERPNVVLVDLQMPAGGGMQLLERLRANRDTAAIPLVMVTASRDAGLEAEAKDHGAWGFLHKPVDREALVAALRDLLPEPEAE